MIKSESQNPIIRFTRDGEIEPSRIVALRALDTFEQLIGQPVIVRYYTSPAMDDIDCMVAIGIKNGIGPDCYHIMSPFDKSLIWGIVTTLEEVDVAKFPTGRERYIYIDPETNKAQYVILNKYNEREFIDITDGPKAYEDLSTGRTIYITSINGQISVCAGYSDEDIRRISEGKLDIKQGIDNANKLAITDNEGNITFSSVNSLVNAGENIEIDENNTISAPNVVPQYTILPPAEENEGKVVQYVGEAGDYSRYKFYTSNGESWDQVRVQGTWTDIVPLTKEEYLNTSVESLDYRKLYIVKDYTVETPTNLVYVSDVFTDNMPEPNPVLEGNTYIYTGTSTDEFLKGRIYTCEKNEDEVYEWQDVSVGDAYIHSYQTYSNEPPYVTGTTVFVDSFEVIEDIYKRVKKMSSFNGVIEVEEGVTVPIIKVNGLKDMTDEDPDKHTIYIDFTVINPATNLPERLVINSNKITKSINYKFYLTIVQ